VTAIGSLLGRIAARSGAADVWFSRVGPYASDVDRVSREYLSTAERSRVTEYRIREAAERYVVTRALVRVVLGQQLRISPRELEISRTDAGKPVISHGVHFNVSHSGDLVLLAVCETAQVGIDVERKRDVARVDALVARWLTQRERAELETLMTRGFTASDAFLRVWSLKEARLKALGVGISGAATAAVHAVEALPLDRLLDGRTHSPSEDGYVGALAFV
jgi:4'-phosphopantetheinyl transferase